LSIFDEETKKKVVPHVIAEPSLGVERAFLVFMFDAYSYDKERDNVVLKLHPKLAPVKVGVFPLLSNKPEIVKKARRPQPAQLIAVQRMLVPIVSDF